MVYAGLIQAGADQGELKKEQLSSRMLCAESQMI
jgi:hypothetical protein